MSGINQYLKERLLEVGGNTLVAPEIPQNKLSNAVNAFKFDGDPASIIGICDTTIFKSAKEGILLSGSKLIYKGMLESPISIAYDDIESVEYVVTVEQTDKGKEKESKVLRVNLASGDALNLKYIPGLDLEKLAEIINGALEKFETYQEQNQLQPIEALAEDLKVAYLKIIVNMAFDNDGNVDDREFSEILLLMTRLNLSVGSRHEIRHYMGSADNAEQVADLIKVIDAHAPDGTRKSLHVSIVKDIISISSSLKNSDASTLSFLQKHRDVFGVTDEEIELVQLAIDNDRKSLDRKYSDSVIKKNLKELSAKAGAVGVPLGAIYLSGSVMGLSAAGITSGLATLGMGGLFGLSSMATGIGTAVIIGVLAYKGIGKLTGSGVDEGDKRREIMLQEVIRQSQRTIKMVNEDINYLSKELTSALASENVTKEKLNQVLAKLSQYIRASKVIGEKAEQGETDRARLKSPEFLDVERLKALTHEHDKRKYFELVVKFYREEVLQEERDGKVVEKTVLRLVRSSDSMEMEQLGQVFELIGYNTVQGAIKGKLKEMLSS